MSDFDSMDSHDKIASTATTVLMIQDCMERGIRWDYLKVLMGSVVEQFKVLITLEDIPPSAKIKVEPEMIAQEKQRWADMDDYIQDGAEMMGLEVPDSPAGIEDLP